VWSALRGGLLGQLYIDVGPMLFDIMNREGMRGRRLRAVGRAARYGFVWGCEALGGVTVSCERLMALIGSGLCAGAGPMDDGPVVLGMQVLRAVGLSGLNMRV